jgi:hypothetical protein
VAIVNFAFLPDGGNPSSFSAVRRDHSGQPTNPASDWFFSFGVTATSASTTLQFNFRDDPGFLYGQGRSPDDA